MRRAGIEFKSPQPGMRHVRWVWTHELEHVRSVMRSRHGAGYKFCLAPSRVSDRLFSLRTNMRLAAQLARRLKNRSHTHPEHARYYERSLA